MEMASPLWFVHVPKSPSRDPARPSYMTSSLLDNESIRICAPEFMRRGTRFSTLICGASGAPSIVFGEMCGMWYRAT